jgi:hypothetical protein
LVAERSARSTFPELEGFRVAALRGFRRVFAHAAPIFFERGIAIEATKVPMPSISLLMSSFKQQASPCVCDSARWI